MKRLADMLSRITKAIDSGEHAIPANDATRTRASNSRESDSPSQSLSPSQIDNLNDPVIERLNVASDVVQPQVRPSQIPVAVVVPGYTLVGEIGRGGQAVVFEAIQDSTGQKVAIKILLNGVFASSHDVARFAREIQILAALNHPYIVRVIDRGATTDGIQFLVMAYVSGLPLTQVLRKFRPNPRVRISPQDTDHLLRLFLKICDAVNSAHLRGVVHRDLKPANILVDENGEPHILDFGLARTVIDLRDNTQETLSIAGQFIGSLPWACPEQALGQHDLIDTRSDVYSLGVILYQILTGEFPYDISGAMHEVIHNIINKTPAPITRRGSKSQSGHATSTIGSFTSGSSGMVLDAIVRKALSKDRKDRYQTAGELARDVSDCLQGKPTQAAGDMSGYSPWVKAGALILMIAGLTLTAFVIGRQMRNSSPIAAILPPAPPTATSTLDSPAPPAGLPTNPPTARAAPGPPVLVSPTTLPDRSRISIGIATEAAKVDWIQSAARAFSQTPRGKNVDVNVISMSVVNSTRAVFDVDRRINLLAPANSYHNKVFVEDWRRLNGRNLVLRSERVAISPLVFLVNKAYFDSRGQPVPDMNFQWIHSQGHSPKSNLAPLRFGTGNPLTTGTGIAALTLMAYEFRGKSGDLTLQEVQDPAFASFLGCFTNEGSRSYSTIEELMQAAIATNPHQLDVAIVPENAVIQKLRQSPGLASTMRLIYPKLDIINDQPVFVLDVPWSNGDQRTAATDFVDYLLTEPAQREALASGLRPVNPRVALDDPQSPFVQFADIGFQIPLYPLADPPPEPVIEALEAAWRKSTASGE